MSERAKRCGTCGAWDEVQMRSEFDGKPVTCIVYYGPGLQMERKRWGVCRRKCDDWPQRGADDWCCEWLPRSDEE